MTDRLSGKTALITGASRGIGRAIAEAYAGEGANLVLNARDPERLEAAAAALRADHAVEVLAHVCDVADGGAVKRMVQAIEATTQIDILVNNAGIHIPARFVDYSFEDFKQVIEVNVYSVFHVTQAVLPAMIERRSGRVVNLASTAGKWGSRNQSAYNASKHAVVGITRCLGLEMAPHNVMVNAICPWVVDTDMKDALMTHNAAAVGATEERVAEALQNSVPLKRWVQPQEVAQLAIFLGSDEASYINGQSWAVDGGYTMI